MYQALYRKYRPQLFEDVVGQKVIIKTLSNSILNNKISHAYLFTGPRGTGKTSIAKIFAKIINCENLNGIDPCNNCVNCTQINTKQSTDIIEIDAASNNGVDEIRELRDKVSLVPSFGKYKVYIIDEVHMLTTAAFNALLKTLEEPPKHIIFILATTEPHKIPQTILSRCQRFDFKKISISDIKSRIKKISELENISIDDDAIELIAKLSDGGMRDALGLLDQLTSYTSEKINVNDVNDVSGMITIDKINELILLIIKGNLIDSFNLLETYDENGKNLVKIVEGLIEFLKNTLIYYNSAEYFKDEDLKKMYSEVCELVSDDEIYKMIETLIDSIKLTKTSNNTRLIFELAIIKIIEFLSSEKPSTKVKSEEYSLIEPKRKIINNTENKQDKITISASVRSKLSNLKKTRINNTLSKFEKKELISFREELDNIRELLMNPDYSSIVSLILDGELKAKGEDYLIFVYNVPNLEEYFNNSLIEIESVFNTQFNKNYKPIAVSSDEWNKIKQEFNDNLKRGINAYEYKEEEYSLDEIYEKSENNEEDVKKTNKIDEIFEDMIEYN